MELTFLGGGPWSLAEPMGAHWDGKIANEWKIGVKHIQTYSKSNINKLANMQLSVEIKQKYLWGEASHTNSKMFAGQATKKCVGVSN